MTSDPPYRIVTERLVLRCWEPRDPRKLGFVEEARLRRRLPAPGGGQPRDVIVFTLFRDAVPGSPAGAVELEAFDAVGMRVL